MDTLPIDAFEGKILEAVKKNSVTIIVAETGAGKSTRVPQMLHRAGYISTITQPRRVAARAVAARVQKEVGDRMGGIVGWRHGGDEGQYSKETEILFVTDGLAFVRGEPRMVHHRPHVLVLDELHEWNIHLEALIALVRDRVRRDPAFKVAFMSATIEAEKVASYLGEYGINVPIIKVPGRTFPITEREPKESMEEDILALVNEGRNVLAFLPGKGEITQMEQLLLMGGLPEGQILELHGQMESEDQDAVLASRVRPCVVLATNVAQTSITVPYIDAVVSSGYERRIELNNGVEGLFVRPISKADENQQVGRAGRTKPGIAVRRCSAANREEYPVPEILRTPLDSVVLKFEGFGFDLRTSPLFHQPREETVDGAYRGLTALGCLDTNGRITGLGREVLQIPTRPAYGRMILEARSRDVLEHIIPAAALIEARGFVGHYKKGVRPTNDWRTLTKGETESDPLAQLNVLCAVDGWHKEDLWDYGLSPTRLKKVRVALRSLWRTVGEDPTEPATVPSAERRAVLECIALGMAVQFEEYARTNVDRRPARNSVVAATGASDEWFVGVPFDIETSRGILPLLEMISRVRTSWIVNGMPSLVSFRDTEILFGAIRLADIRYLSEEDLRGMLGHHFPEVLERELDRRVRAAKAAAEREAERRVEEAERLRREEEASRVRREEEIQRAKLAEAARLAAEENARLDAEGAALGLSSDVEIWRRREGATNAGDGWVIKPDGTTRTPDEMRCPRPRYPDEGYQLWRQVRPGELVLQWSKHNTAADHCFTVVHLPETVTDAQLKAVGALEDEFEQEWEGRRGLASRIESPSVGNGWGIPGTTRTYNRMVSESPKQPEKKEPPTRKADGVTPEMLQALKERFG